MTVSDRKLSRGSAHGQVALAVRRALVPTGVALLMAGSLVAAPARAQDSGSTQNVALEQVTVTGTRIVRDGYEAPTPVTVIGVEQLDQAPTQHISDFVSRLPAFGGALRTDSGGNEIGGGRQSQNNLNLRGLDVFRTLVLLDGHRIVAGDVNGAVNINDLPQSLISRVDVITGGASAAYGSDALAGVVNFVLDKNYTGVKADLQGGLTSHGDNASYKASLTAGTPFADGRGHFLVSGEYARNDGILGFAANRDWSFDTAKIIANPAYGPDNTSVPQFLIRSQASTLLAAPGGLVTSGPLRGTMFNPDGSPTQYHYGSLTNSQYNVGGDWEYTDATRTALSIANRLARKNAFARVSFDLTDNVTAFVNFIYSDSIGLARSKHDDTLGTSKGGITIQRDNPFLDPAIAARMDALDLDSFVMGSFNLDLGHIYTDNRRRMLTYAAGLEGNFDAFGSNWKWEAFGQVGTVDSDLNARVMNRQNYKLAVDSVRNADGSIVCRVNADASTANDVPGCVPWNPFGWNQNGPTAIAFAKGVSHLTQQSRQSVATVGISGDLFDSWAGPVSLATGVEWRKEEVEGTPDALSLEGVYSAGNYKGTNGSYTVTEGYIETVVPLANDQAWARSLDFNAAARFTDYSISGYVTTWKAGLTYNPIDDLRIRFTRSRDIRAPNLGELFAAGQCGQSVSVLDPFNNNAPLPAFLGCTVGNLDLQPEKADTTGFGVVYQPSYLDGFSVAVDLYDIDIDGAVDTVGTQDIMNRCFLGQQEYCDRLTRNAAGQITVITVKPSNLANLHQRGVDIEASYTKGLDEIFPSLRGDLDLRALGTHVAYSRRDDGLNPVTDSAGDNSGSGPLNWRWLFSAGYSLDPISVTWTGRYLSAGDYGPPYVQCSANCPESTPFAQTIDSNSIPSKFYHDLSVSYNFDTEGGASGQVYLNIANLMDEEPPSVANTNYALSGTNPVLYDTIGRAFYAGIRIKM